MLKRGLYAGLALGFPAVWGSGCSGGRRGTRPNVVLITLDTTRVDHLGCYGYRRRTSPNLDALAEQSVLYSRAIATSSWTLPSHASLFTGKFTTSHGARYDPEGPLRLKDAINGPASWDRYRARGLSADQRTLAQILKEAGYATGSVVAGPWMKRVFGLANGFDFYDDSGIGSSNGRLAPSVTASAGRWIEEFKDREFFLFLNYYDPHGPLTPPQELAQQFLPASTELRQDVPLTPEQHLALYDAEILFMDQQVGILLEKMKRLGIYDNSWIIVTADHGELFGEHGKFGHGHFLFQPEIHIPMFMKFPAGERAPAREEPLVQLTDILPAVCRRLELPVPEGIQGRVPGEAHPVVAETYPLPSAQYAGDWRAFFEGDYKLLWNSESQHRLYNLKDDPGEAVDLADQDSARAQRMQDMLDGYLSGLPRPTAVGPDQELDEKTRDALKGLGYVN